MDNILVIEDNLDIKRQMKFHLSENYQVIEASGKDSVVELLEKYSPSVITLNADIRKEGTGESDGLNCLKKLLEINPNAKIIVITDQTEIETMLEAFLLGAYDCLSSPVDMSKLKVIIERALFLSKIDEHLDSYHGKEEPSGIIGDCPEIQKILDTINKIAIANTPVLITGETGTEKEIVARAIHDKSYINSAFISLNSSSVSSESIDFIILDQAKDTFTSTRKSDNKQFEITLFFDNVNELSKDSQIKLFNILQNNMINVRKGNSHIDFKVRVLAATQKKLYDEIKAGNFREDVFFRINTIEINIPPLRERGFDINLLANMFLDKYKRIYKKKIKGLSKDAIDAMLAYSWPGNVIELETKVQGAVLTVESYVIEPHDLGLELKMDNASPMINSNNPYFGLSLKEARRKLEIDLIKNTIEKYHGNIKKVAEDLGVSRPTIYDMLDKYKLPYK